MKIGQEEMKVRIIGQSEAQQRNDGGRNKLHSIRVGTAHPKPGGGILAYVDQRIQGLRKVKPKTE
jgi:hypothetical protein